MPTKPRRSTASAVSASPASTSSKQAESSLRPIVVDRSQDITESRDPDGKRTKSSSTTRPVVGFSALQSAFDVSGQKTKLSKRPQALNQKPGHEMQRNTKAVIMTHKSDPDVIVLDSSDIEEVQERPVAKRLRTSASSRKVPTRIVSSDEDFEQPQGKGETATTEVNRRKQMKASLLEIESQGTEAMWSEAYAPLSVTELATSKNRIKSVQIWLEEALFGRPRAVDSDIPFSEQAKDRIRKYRRILVLSGPAGVGKTTTLRLVAKELGAEVVEWEEGVEDWSMSGQIERESLNSKLVGFLSRNAYQPLSLGAQSSTSNPKSRRKEVAVSSQVASLKSANPPRILLFTSLPNLSHVPTREVFQRALIDYTKSYSTTSCPLVIIVPDAGSSGAAEESWNGADRGGEASWDLRTVLGKDLTASPAVGVVEFLPMAPTFMIKALKRIAASAFTDVKSRPSQEFIQLIAHSANGDLRSAINSLQFLSRSGNSRNAITSTSNALVSGKKTGKGSRGGKGTKLKGSEEVRTLLNAIARREQSLGLFHALGKIMYNKRFGDMDDETSTDPVILKKEEQYQRDHPLPAHLAQHERRRYENDFDSLIASVPVDTASFMLWIHQNLPQFCAQIEEVGEAYDYICHADLTRADDDLWQRSPHAIAYAFHLAVRGSLAALPHPVPKNGQKLVKPQFFGHMKTKRENEDSIIEAAKWLTARCIRQNDILDEADTGKIYGGWGGQLSRKVIATEFMPGLRLLKKCGSHVPSSIIPDDRKSFTFAEANESQLEVLTENAGVPEGNPGEGDLEDMLFVGERQSQHSAAKSAKWDEDVDQETQTPTWLEDDDIEEL
ncbi:hypothetical protein QFC24_005953 [Naganishia onofrii]|uniref:Uncharacterized protein n=1 Tax=Naganishia onofrii TaxID=1851511 RepID=A0ACC2X4Z8_9TREE|nr:hypothetical protein QFC24_005953 [Naganishia onofrii]